MVAPALDIPSIQNAQAFHLKRWKEKSAPDVSAEASVICPSMPKKKA
jgi:hypothetical protein